MTDAPKRSGPKGPRLPHDTTSPAYRIIYGVFGGLSEFCRATDIKPPTAHLWLVNGIIPDNKGHRHAHILACAKAKGLELPPEMFVRAAVPNAA
jgi:hypothetical protein